MAHTIRRSGSNLDRIEAVLERRRSNAAGTHADRRTRRARTRSAALRREIRIAATS